MKSTRGKDRFFALDSWRGIAAVAVAISHFSVLGVSHINDYSFNFPRFVDFFFVLSGFVISFAYWERLQNWAELKLFALRRFARLWPLHMACIVPLFILNLAWLWKGRPAFEYPYTFTSLVSNMFLTQTFWPHPILTWTVQSWSISVEFWTYFVFAGICLFTPRKWSRIVAILAAILSATMIIVSARIHSESVGEQYFGRALVGFFSGQCVYFLWLDKPFRLSSRYATFVEIAALIPVFILLAAPAAEGAPFLLQSIIFGFLIWVFMWEEGIISRGLLKSFPRLLGQLSYSIYMVHMLVLGVIGLPLRHGFQRFAVNKTAGDAIVIIFIATTIAVSWCTFRWVEKPSTRIFGPKSTPHLPE